MGILGTADGFQRNEKGRSMIRPFNEPFLAQPLKRSTSTLEQPGSLQADLPKDSHIPSPSESVDIKIW